MHSNRLSSKSNLSWQKKYYRQSNWRNQNRRLEQQQTSWLLKLRKTKEVINKIRNKKLRLVQSQNGVKLQWTVRPHQKKMKNRMRLTRVEADLMSKRTPKVKYKLKILNYKTNNLRIKNLIMALCPTLRKQPTTPTQNSKKKMENRS